MTLIGLCTNRIAATVMSVQSRFHGAEILMTLDCKEHKDMVRES